MLILLGVWLAVGGMVGMLAGLSGLRRVRRLRRSGESAWAVAVPPVLAGGEAADRAWLRYTLPDGRVAERRAPAAARKPTLQPGQKVLIWYDPADPDDILVYGRWGRGSDWAFLASGLVLAVAGVAVAVIGG